MRNKLYDLAFDFPDLIELTDSEQAFGIKHRVTCANDLSDFDPCVVDIVRLTNKTSTKPKKVIYVSGAFHGNERIGPNVTVYFLEYFVSQYLNGETQVKERFQTLLDNIEVVLTPMTNAPGYRRNHREEKISDEAKDRMRSRFGKSPEDSFDINRDFPFD